MVDAVRRRSGLSVTLRSIDVIAIAQQDLADWTAVCFQVSSDSRSGDVDDVVRLSEAAY